MHKYRLWDTEEERMIYPALIAFDHHGRLHEFLIEENDGHPTTCLFSHRFVVQKFTGFVDKNRKEIWEGNVVREIFRDKFYGENMSVKLGDFYTQYFGDYDCLQDRFTGWYLTDGAWNFSLTVENAGDYEVVSDMYEPLISWEDGQ